MAHTFSLSSFVCTPSSEVSTTCVSRWIQWSIRALKCLTHPLTQVVLTSLRFILIITDFKVCAT